MDALDTSQVSGRSLKSNKRDANKMRKVVSVLVTMLMGLSLALVSAAPASALTCKPNVPRGSCHAYELLNKSKRIHVKGPRVGSCHVTSNGSTCTIQVSTSKEGSIGTAFGMSTGAVAAELNTSRSVSATYSVSCTSPTLKKGQTYKAWADKTVYKYKVHHVWKAPGRSKDETSGWRYTHKYAKNAIICGT